MAFRLEYIATDADRWDNLAYDFYGDASKISILMAANPGIMPDVMYIQAGTRINVPVPSKQVQQEITDIKAPWK